MDKRSVSISCSKNIFGTLCAVLRRNWWSFSMSLSCASMLINIPLQTRVLLRLLLGSNRYFFGLLLSCKTRSPFVLTNPFQCLLLELVFFSKHIIKGAVNWTVNASSSWTVLAAILYPVDCNLSSTLWLLQSIYKTQFHSLPGRTGLTGNRSVVRSEST